MDLQLEGRAIVVTGGSSGVGRATVERLLAEGAQVATCARNDERLARAWPHRQDRLYLHAGDVRDEAAMDGFIRAAAKRFGRIDAVVANAGEGLPSTFTDATPKDWLAELEGKVLGAVLPVRAALPWLRRSDAGRVVLIGALIAREPEPTLVTASAARAALANLARSMATELAADEILVNTVSLGIIDTERQRAVHAASGSIESYQQWAVGCVRRRGVPLGRMGRPEEVAPAVALLVSPLASYISGTDITVAGGAGHSAH
ncbi:MULTISPECIES: SDR family oxidoreductase [unclassified Streptomyces]|uniref:SDR family oxidoreductase n=1 Tax=unclassified Streptomyces TaxID=2593676 RepID=UPI001F049483|nr:MULTISPECIES: SDR family oxidoreductase [unclassified Streptomyces]MCH0564839.1 SDR family oxidoreductase [Streptomyces sp. MUM 2J]MCH0569887.1 SDR family oxidoreductase [Streptomyces sp. MUM 136J]